ncbi:MAG: signal peptidase II [Holosporaceae bacterium]|jgi:signal peptidase II|nr:signal peptidase II [Holosporaceae bacterium]
MQKMPKCLGSKWTVAFLSFFILLGDQASKFAVARRLRLGEHHTILPFFNIVRFENKGISFGMFNGAASQLFWILLSAAVVVALCLRAKNNRCCWLPLGMVASGAIGNSMDRIIYGAVVDFLDFHISTYHWPAFNIADSVIVVGAIILFFISNREVKP